MPRKRALFIVITDYPGGAERVMSALASELALRPDWNVEFMVACSQRPRSFTKANLPATARTKFGFSHNWYLSFATLPFRIIFRRYDLVFTTHVYVNALISLMRNLKLIRTDKLALRESMSLFDRFKGAKTILFKALYRSYGAEDVVIAQTCYMADHARPWLPEISRQRLRVIPNPVDLAKVQQALAEPLDAQLRKTLEVGTNILFCGRLVDFKRPGLAVEVFHLLKDEYPSAKLVMLGDGPLQGEVRHLVSSLDLGDRVLILGERSNPYPVMAMCHYGLVTSANEGFPNVVLEMMACGVSKIVMTPCAGDLESLTGVTVTRSHRAWEIAAALHRSLLSGEDHRSTYLRVAESRSPRDYIEQVLATAEPARAG